MPVDWHQVVSSTADRITLFVFGCLILLAIMGIVDSATSDVNDADEEIIDS